MVTGNDQCASPSPAVGIEMSHKNLNEPCKSSQHNGVTSDGNGHNEISTLPIPNSAITGGKKQLKKSSKKEESSSRSKETPNKTSVKGILRDDSGTNQLLSLPPLTPLTATL
jgi:hypothetical protein